MKILIAAATETEIKPFMEQRPQAEVLITGVGPTHTLFALMQKTEEENYDMIIQAGIAGSFDKDIKIGDVFFVQNDCFGDPGIYEGGNYKTIFEYGFMDPDQNPYTAGRLHNPYQSSLTHCDAVTVALVHDIAELNTAVQRVYKARLESMEGASLHYVCLQKNIPFQQLRAVSNYVGDRNKANWNIGLAIEKLNETLIKEYDKLNANNKDRL